MSPFLLSFVCVFLVSFVFFGCERLESNQLSPAYETGEIPFLYAAISNYLLVVYTLLINWWRISDSNRLLLNANQICSQLYQSPEIRYILLISLYSVCKGEFWCPRSDSNRHALRRQNLNLVRLPISPPGHILFMLRH